MSIASLWPYRAHVVPCFPCSAYKLYVLHGGDYLVQVAYVELSGFNLSSSMNVTAAGFAQLRFRGQANVSILMMQRQRLTLLLFATLVVLPCHAGRSGRGYQHRVFPLLCQLYGEASPGIPKEFGEVSNCMSDASFLFILRDC